eukprot:TRINITY_DN13485_c0_g1_i1.p1 TRINITY_DN13485_c0_g1~~TRINITY_DN13485_c0_g1_i1.p1  ORF type:complete len:235 (+),score=30.22 TRINITY_DN13485_c0_g1_i1:88-792(+)
MMSFHSPSRHGATDPGLPRTPSKEVTSPQSPSAERALQRIFSSSARSLRQKEMEERIAREKVICSPTAVTPVKPVFTSSPSQSVQQQQTSPTVSSNRTLTAMPPPPSSIDDSLDSLDSAEPAPITPIPIANAIVTTTVKYSLKTAPSVSVAGSPPKRRRRSNPELVAQVDVLTRQLTRLTQEYRGARARAETDLVTVPLRDQIQTVQEQLRQLTAHLADNEDSGSDSDGSDELS